MNIKEWRKILKLAIKGRATFDDKRKMLIHSKDWNTCAVGARLMCLAKIDRIDMSLTNECAVGMDEKVWHLGNYVFLNAISESCWKRALEILEEIYKKTKIFQTQEQQVQILEKIIS